MLNISENRIAQYINKKDYESFKLLKKNHIKRLSLVLVSAILVGVIICMFLPWRQNVSAKGYVTTLSPEQQPQGIQSVIDGRIEKWYIQEGDSVKKGDTIVFLSEVKSEYFDSELITRTNEQLEAKNLSVASYQDKIDALQGQYNALRQGLDLKQEQLRNKVLQVENKIKIDSIDLIAYKNNQENDQNQLDRVRELQQKGLKSLSDLQAKENKVQQMNAKVEVQKKKLMNQRNELLNIKIALLAAEQEYANKMAKSRSDLQSALAMKLDGLATRSKLTNKLANIEQRQQLYYVTAPQDGVIAKALKKGLGETVKKGSSLVTIMPDKYDPAIEIFVKPQDIPLIHRGDPASIRFDGWPTVVISGWPQTHIGVFHAKVAAINRFMSKKGYYRVLLVPNEEGRKGGHKKVWPNSLNAGTGANAFILLKEVPLWYEIWRQLNGFPLDYYSEEIHGAGKVKKKAPLKSIK